MAGVVGVLALQGAFREHVKMLQALGARTRELRQAKDLAGVEALVLPGGESTTIGKLLLELNMLEPLREMIIEGAPVFGTCAGLILLCKDIAGSDQPRIGVLDAKIERNAFGRQNESFETMLDIPEWGEKPFPGVFIRAPLIEKTGPQVKILASLNRNGTHRPVAVRQKNILGISFHPELSGDGHCHEYFLKMR